MEMKHLLVITSKCAHSWQLELVSGRLSDYFIRDSFIRYIATYRKHTQNKLSRGNDLEIVRLSFLLDTK